MAFVVPQFPLVCEVFSGPWLTRVSRGTLPCNLALGRRGIVFPDFEASNADVFSGPTYLLFPPGADVRDMNCNVPAQDFLEVPQGSGRWYSVGLVDDLGKGFANEHRYALINKVSERTNATLYAGLFWPVPIP